jgi:hypothetical protein
MIRKRSIVVLPADQLLPGLGTLAFIFDILGSDEKKR